MLFRTAFVAVALATVSEDGPDGQAPQGALLEDLEVMQRVLSRKVAERSPAITGSSTFAALDRLWPHFTGKEPDPALVAEAASNYYLQLARGESAADYGTRADYLPGFGAVFSMSVPIRLEWIPLEADPEDSGPEVEKSGLWEEIEREVRGDPAEHRVPIVSDLPVVGHMFRGPSNRVTPGSVDMSDSALDLLQETLLKALVDYGHHIDLPEHENIAVSVHLKQGKADWLAGVDPRLYSDFDADGDLDLFVANQLSLTNELVLADHDQDGFLDITVNPQPTEPRWRRLVLQIRVADLKDPTRAKVNRL